MISGTVVGIVIDNWDRLQSTALAFHMMQLACEWQSPQPFLSASESQGVLFNKHVGSSKWWKEITTFGKSVRVEAFLKDCTTKAKRFREKHRPFWLYPN